MENKSICRRVSSMLSLYIDNHVTYQESAFIEDHLSNCPECHAKYIYLQSLVKELKDSYKLVAESVKKKQEQRMFNIREHEKFLNQLYPYIDNELPEKACIDFQTYLAKSPSAQRKLNNTYKIQKELKTSYDKIKNSFGSDFSQKIINELKPKNKNLIQTAFFSQKTIKVAILAGLIVFGGIELDHLFLVQQDKHSHQQNYSKQRNTIKPNTEKINKK